MTLSPAEAEQILEHILNGWCNGPLRQRVEEPHAWDSVYRHKDFLEVFATALGRAILPYLEVGSARVDEAAGMIEELRGLDCPVESTYPALARLRPELLPTLSNQLRQSLVSSRREQAEAAVAAIWWWLRERGQVGLGEPSPDLVREIAIAVSMRRPSLQGSLRMAEWVLRNGALADGEAELFAQRVAEGEDVSEVLVCYALRVYESQRNLQPHRVTP